MSYQVLLPKSVQKEMDKLPSGATDSLIKKILELRKDPRPPGSIKMQASQGWRIRSGEYRVIYDIDDKIQMVVIRRVGHRREIYR